MIELGVTAEMDIARAPTLICGNPAKEVSAKKSSANPQLAEIAETRREGSTVETIL
jgi:hypothetical protein